MIQKKQYQKCNQATEDERALPIVNISTPDFPFLIPIFSSDLTDGDFPKHKSSDYEKDDSYD